LHALNVDASPLQDAFAVAGDDLARRDADLLKQATGRDIRRAHADHRDGDIP
jgi:hypothetical protein